MPENTDEEVKWSYLVQLIKQEKLTPLLSNKLTLTHLFGHKDIAEEWAEKIEYPLSDISNLAHIALYYCVINGGDEWLTKVDFLDFLKKKLLEVNKTAPNSNPSFLGFLEDGLSELTLSDIAKQLDYISAVVRPSNPFSILAKLPLPLYLTTSYHTLMEKALEEAGRSPQIGVYHWNEALWNTFEPDGLLASLTPQANVKPTVENPLVYHLLGIDTIPQSLVLTEDNYFDFLENISQDLERPGDRPGGIPIVVHESLSRTALFLLGYNLYGWDFRVAFRGSIKRILQTSNFNRPHNLLIQLNPGPENSIKNKQQVQNYLANYFSTYKFKIYWSDVEGFVSNLWNHLG
ncbi:MAG: SIR2 family protein [Anaerolineae bacterium]|nr:SIR2 family protein [Anaerolineae bacterium]